MAESSSNSGCGCGSFCGLLFLIFLTLKLAEVGVVATWDWWWVFSPLIAYAAICGVFFAVMFVIIGIATYFASKE